MRFDNWFHDKIYKELDKKGVVHFNETLRLVNKNRPQNKKEVTTATLSSHLTKMVEQNILEKHHSEKGFGGSYEFTQSVKLLRKIGIFKGVKSERDEYDFDESKNPNTILTKILRKTLYAKGMGVKGDNSFSNEDIIDNEPGFTNITFKSNTKINDKEVEKIVLFCDEQLRISDPAIFHDSNFDLTGFKKIRRIIKDYLTICAEISAYIIVRLQSTWTHIRKPKNPELYWYSETLGQDKLLHFLENEKKERKEYAKEFFKNISDVKNEVLRRISIWDELIISRQKELDELLKQMDEKYHPICNLVNEFSYPKFMRDLHTSRKI